MRSQNLAVGDDIAAKTFMPKGTRRGGGESVTFLILDTVEPCYMETARLSVKHEISW